MSELTIQTSGNTRTVSRLITHGGVFHADEVVITAILELLTLYQDAGCGKIMDILTFRDSVELEVLKLRSKNRTESNPLNIFHIPITRSMATGELPAKAYAKGNLVYDLGDGEFCHKDADGKRCASITNMWAYLKESNWFTWLSDEMVSKFYSHLIKPVEDQFNTGGDNTLTYIISVYNVNAEATGKYDSQFSNIVMEVMRILNQWLHAMVIQSIGPENVVV